MTANQQSRPLPERAAVPAVRLRGISKRFGPVQANRDISLDVQPGTIHGIIGENGAGKSTLMSILYGFVEPDEGTIELFGEPVQLASSLDAIAKGVGMVHQHFMLVDRFTVMENVMLGAEGGALLSQGYKRVRSELARLGREFGMVVDPDVRASELPVGELQRVEILKALLRGAKVLILDEPTGVLTPQETDQLLKILLQLKAQGCTILIITHKLREIMAVTDEVTVMRAGQVVGSVATRDTNEAELAEMMVGRAVRRAPMVTEREPGAALLKVSGLSWTDARGVKRLHDLNFELRAGEIVGVAGVAGNGQSELLQVLSGIDAMQEGQIELGGQLIDASREVDARGMRALGLSHVPEDRHKQGLVMSFQAWESAALGYHREDCYAKLGLMDQGQMKADCQAMMDDFDVRPPLPLLGSSKFSGGNQQKLILAREMKHAPKVLLIGQPTRGVDIGAIELIHQRIVAMRDAGVAVLVVSTELDEILGLSDRVLVMNEGHITGELSREEADEPSIGRLMAHSKKGAGQQADAPETPSEGVAP